MPPFAFAQRRRDRAVGVDEGFIEKAATLLAGRQPRPPTRPDLRSARVSDLGFVLAAFQAGSGVPSRLMNLRLARDRFDETGLI